VVGRRDPADLLAELLGHRLHHGVLSSLDRCSKSE
jgi:hypothetical protein